MDRWIELSRVYRRLLCRSASFKEALAGLRVGGDPDFRRLLDEGTDWAAIAALNLDAETQRLLGWYQDIRACDLGPGIDIVHIDLGNLPQAFEVSAWRWADRIMLIDDGLIEPDSIRTISSPGRSHKTGDLPAGLFSEFPHSSICGDFAAYAVWLLFCSFVPLEAFGESDLKSIWGIDREFSVVFNFERAIFHGGFVTPNGWKRPLKLVEVPHHS